MLWIRCSHVAKRKSGHDTLGCRAETRLVQRNFPSALFRRCLHKSLQVSRTFPFQLLWIYAFLYLLMTKKNIVSIASGIGHRHRHRQFTTKAKTAENTIESNKLSINRIYSPSMITIAMKNVQFTIFVLFAHKLLIVSSKDSFFSLQFFFYIYCFLQAFRVCIYENIFYI